MNARAMPSSEEPCFAEPASSHISLPLVASRSERAGRLVRRAMRLFESDRLVAWRCLSIASTLLTDDTELTQSQASATDRSYGLAPWQARRVIEYIESNIEAKLNLHALATLVGLSKGHFSRAFRQREGLPPMSYIAVRRVERAKAMMTSSHDPLTEIAAACGFGDQPHLTRWFRRIVGMTPGQYRRLNWGQSGDPKPSNHRSAFDRRISAGSGL